MGDDCWDCDEHEDSSKNSSDYQMKRNDCLMNTPCCKNMSLGDFLLQNKT